MDFYFNRFARILPVYYICFIIGAILIPFGHSYFAPDNLWFNAGGSILSLFLVQTWVIIFGLGPNGPSWTVSTLFFFYLVFPRFDLIKVTQINYVSRNQLHCTANSNFDLMCKKAKH